MPERVGQQLGNYRLISLLGRGGFAEVYLGEHIYLKTPGAIKLLQTKLANQEDLANFLTEAQTIAKLVHPHIVRVLEFGLDGETPYLVMDYAPNGTLRQRHPRGTQLPLTTIISYVKQIAEALHYAHEEKFIHRDIKPENMLVGRRNTILLSDFGIALIAQSSRYQVTQEVIGTVAYMSPEQIEGKPRPASDQYSLGVVVYEWLTGDRPFHGSFTELCTQHMFALPGPLREKTPGLSPTVEQVVMKALSKDAKQRFPSIQDFADALEQASSGQLYAGANSVPGPELQPTVVQTPRSQPLSPTAPATPNSAAGERNDAIGSLSPRQDALTREQASQFISPWDGVQPILEQGHPIRQPYPAPPAPFSPTGETLSPVEPQSPKHGLSRRTVVASLVGVGIAALAAGGGITWLLVSESSNSAQVINVHMAIRRFLPSVVTISKGSSIRLIDDTAAQQVINNGMWVDGTSLPAVEPGAPVVNNLVFNAAGQRRVIGPFNTSGTFHLYCTIRLGMNLMVIVQ
jgi:serine/threonine protein kinase